MQPIAPIESNTNVIGYQFTDVGVVFVEIIIGCEGYYDELLDPILLSFYLDVGNYTNMGGGFVVPNDNASIDAIELELNTNANKVD